MSVLFAISERTKKNKNQKTDPGLIIGKMVFSLANDFVEPFFLPFERAQIFKNQYWAVLGVKTLCRPV